MNHTYPFEINELSLPLYRSFLYNLNSLPMESKLRLLRHANCTAPLAPDERIMTRYGINNYPPVHQLSKSGQSLPVSSTSPFTSLTLNQEDEINSFMQVPAPVDYTIGDKLMDKASREGEGVERYMKTKVRPTAALPNSIITTTTTTTTTTTSPPASATFTRSTMIKKNRLQNDPGLAATQVNIPLDQSNDANNSGSSEFIQQDPFNFNNIVATNANFDPNSIEFGNFNPNLIPTFNPFLPQPQQPLPPQVPQQPYPFPNARNPHDAVNASFFFQPHQSDMMSPTTTTTTTPGSSSIPTPTTNTIHDQFAMTDGTEPGLNNLFESQFHPHHNQHNNNNSHNNNYNSGMNTTVGFDALSGVNSTGTTSETESLGHFQKRQRVNQAWNFHNDHPLDQVNNNNHHPPNNNNHNHNNNPLSFQSPPNHNHSLHNNNHEQQQQQQHLASSNMDTINITTSPSTHPNNPSHLQQQQSQPNPFQSLFIDSENEINGNHMYYPPQPDQWSLSTALGSGGMAFQTSHFASFHVNNLNDLTAAAATSSPFQISFDHTTTTTTTTSTAATNPMQIIRPSSTTTSRNGLGNDDNDDFNHHVLTNNNHHPHHHPHHDQSPLSNKTFHHYSPNHANFNPNHMNGSSSPTPPFHTNTLSQFPPQQQQQQQQQQPQQTFYQQHPSSPLSFSMQIGTPRLLAMPNNSPNASSSSSLLRQQQQQQQQQQQNSQLPNQNQHIHNNSNNGNNQQHQDQSSATRPFPFNFDP
jgi:hypothetical protein